MLIKSGRNLTFEVLTESVRLAALAPAWADRWRRCGAHFVGLNARQLPWSLEGRLATDYIREHWRCHRPALYQRASCPAG